MCSLVSFQQGSLILVHKVVLSRLAAVAAKPSKVKDITVTKIPSSEPGLSVTWSAVRGSNITYTVCYSMEEGRPRKPPPNKSVCIAEIPEPYIQLYPLSKGTTYYIWVRAVSSDGQGAYSKRRMETTYNGTVFVAVYQYFTHAKYQVGESDGYTQIFDHGIP